MKKMIMIGILIILALVCVLSACAAKTYKVDFCGEQQMYDGAKDSYAPGKEVTLRYTLIASDTSYAFYLDGEELDVEYDSNKGYFIRFTMPDHDVRLECVTKNTMADQIPVLEAEPEENLSGNEPEEPVKKAVQLLTLSKFFAQQWEWDDEILLALSEYNGVTLYGDSIGKYPALSETFEQTKNMVVRSMNDEYDNLLVTAKEELALVGADSFEPMISTLDVQIRRADSVAVSLLSDNYLKYEFIDGRFMHGTTYDTQTGNVLMLTDVITDMSKIPEIVKKELTSHTWTGDFISDTAVEDYFSNTPEEGISWTLDHNGVTFYFGDWDLAEIKDGRLAATVSFAEYPELFNEKYMTIPESYIVELPLNHPFYTDLDGDGTLDELSITPFTDESGLFWDSFAIFTDTDAQYYHADFSADTAYRTGGYHPYYIKTADDRHYLYVFAEGSELAAGDMILRVIDISGGGFREVGDMHIAPGYIPIDCFYALTDPENMMLENFELMEEVTAYRVGDDGMPVRK